jgi:hypothetical protein
MMFRQLKKLLNYQNAPQQCAKVEFICEKFGGSFSKKFSGRSRTKESKLPAHYQGCFLGVIPKGRVLGHGSVISPDGFFLARDVAQDFGCDENAHWLVKKDALLKPTHRLKGSSWVASINLSSNYYHWLFEEVPRIMEGLADGHHRVLVSGGNPVRADFIKMVDSRKRTFPLSGYSHYLSDQLMVPSIPGRLAFGQHYDSTEPTEGVVEILENLPIDRAKISTCDKVFVSRRHSKFRRLLNQDEIEHFLKGKGFGIFCLEKMGFGEQTRLFSNAKVVLAPHGAGLANLVFCKKQTKVIELFSHRYFNPIYKQLCEMKCIQHESVFDREELGLTCNDCYADFEIKPIERLIKYL